MACLKQSKFAEHIGVDPSYIKKIKERLTLVKHKNYKTPWVDLLGTKTLEYLKANEQKIKEAQETKKPKSKEAQEIIEELPKLEKNTTVGNNPSGLLSHPDDTTKLELEKLKIKEQTEQIKIKNEMIRGDLIEKKHVVKLFAKIHEIDQNQFKTLNIKVVPKISSVYNVANDNNTKLILKIIGKESDKDLKTEIVAMLNAGEEDRILENTKILEDATGEILAAVMRETDDWLKNMGE